MTRRKKLTSRHSQIAALMLAILMDRSAMLWGPPGQGKSKTIRDGLAKLGRTIKVMRVNTILPYHLSASLIPSPDGTCVKAVPPDWVLELNKVDLAVLFLDDLSAASPTNQTAALGLLDEREIAGVKLKALPLAASNPGALATPRFELDAAAANRTMHIPVTSDADHFAEIAEAGFPAPFVPGIRTNWKELIPRKRSLVLDFLTSNEGRTILNAMPDRITMKTVAWPSERTWEMLWEVLAICDAILPESLPQMDMLEVRNILMTATVGEGAIKKFIGFFTKKAEASVEEALKKGKTFRLPETGDEIYGLFTAVTSTLQSRLDQATLNQAWGLLENAWESAHRDRAVPFAQDLVSLSANRFALPSYYEKKVRPALEGTV